MADESVILTSNEITQRYSGAEIHRGMSIDNHKHLRELQYVLASEYDARVEELQRVYKLVNHWAGEARRLESAHETGVDWKARAETAEGILGHNMALANATTRRTMTERDGIVRKLREKYSAIEIADMVGLTRQRVHQILNEAHELKAGDQQ